MTLRSFLLIAVSMSSLWAHDVPESADSHQLKVFMSFAVPIESWQDLSAQLQKTEGCFVLRGIPDCSFERFAEHVLELRLAGVHAPIDIDPEAFRQHCVESVPAFVLEEGGSSDRIVGNVRLDAALRKMADAGDTGQNARAILQTLERSG